MTDRHTECEDKVRILIGFAIHIEGGLGRYRKYKLYSIVRLSFSFLGEIIQCCSLISWDFLFISSQRFTDCLSCIRKERRISEGRTQWIHSVGEDWQTDRVQEAKLRNCFSVGEGISCTISTSIVTLAALDFTCIVNVILFVKIQSCNHFLQISPIFFVLLSWWWCLYDNNDEWLWRMMRIPMMIMAMMNEDDGHGRPSTICLSTSWTATILIVSTLMASIYLGDLILCIVWDSNSKLWVKELRHNIIYVYILPCVFAVTPWNSVESCFKGELKALLLLTVLTLLRSDGCNKPVCRSTSCPATIFSSQARIHNWPGISPQSRIDWCVSASRLKGAACQSTSCPVSPPLFRQHQTIYMATVSSKLKKRQKSCSVNCLRMI